MKKIFLIVSSLGLASCGTLDIKGKCFYAEIPSQYLIDNRGQLVIDPSTQQKIINPEYTQYTQCHGQPQMSQNESSLGSIKDHLKSGYSVNNKNFNLNGQRNIKPEGGYIESVFTTPDNNSAIKQEIFFYTDKQPFAERFFRDINEKEGRFEKQSVHGIQYILGKNNRGHYIIYIVKNLDQNNISIVQYISQSLIQNSELEQLVKDLNSV